MEVLALRGGDAEGLLHEAVGLVPVPVGLTVVVVLVAAAARVWCLAGAPPRCAEAAAALALHLPVGEEAARYPAGTPRFAVRPPAHAGFPLVPNKDGARPDGLALLL